MEEDCALLGPWPPQEVANPHCQIQGPEIEGPDASPPHHRVTMMLVLLPKTAVAFAGGRITPNLSKNDDPMVGGNEKVKEIGEGNGGVNAVKSRGRGGET